MNKLHIITPVKDSIDLALETAKAILESEINIPYTYTIYNDFSSSENTKRLIDASKEMGFNLVNLADITNHPSPNYLLVLQMCQRKAIEDCAGLFIIESDVIVKKNTIQALWNGVKTFSNCGILAAATVNENGKINYPYNYAKGRENQVYAVEKHCSFCCSLLSLDFLKSFDFNTLNPQKNWFDVTISHESLKRGFSNYLFTIKNIVVWHRPHSSRPWKLLKYKNPIKYYWLKYTKGLDKI